MDNIILLSDSYKVSHWRQYPPGTEYVYSYFESRGCDREGWDNVCFFGLQYFLKKYLVGEVVTREKIDEAEKLYAEHFENPELFYREGWEYILERHGGRLPVEIRAVPEGMVVPLKTVLMTAVNTDPNCFWLTNFLETLLVQVWYPTAVCTNSRNQKISIHKYLLETGCQDWAPPGGTAYKLHDFGFRGVSSVESAAMGGLAHLVNFLGTDTVAALVAGQRYYGVLGAAGHSIPASEHSTITSWGVNGEVDAMRNMLEQYPTGLVACVSDSFDIYRACREYWGFHLKDLIKGRITETSFGRLVVRPDSGDPAETCTEILNILCEQFAEDVTLTPTGHRLLPPYIRVIQGDGVDYKSIPQILQRLMDEGLAAENLGFGSGGALLQKLDRDTLKVAFKCSEIIINGEPREVFKDPITDDGKASKKGRLTLQLASDFADCSEQDVYKPRQGEHGVKGGTGFLHFTPDGQFVTVASGMGDPGRDLLVEVFLDGELRTDWTLDEIRQRADIPDGPFSQTDGEATEHIDDRDAEQLSSMLVEGTGAAEDFLGGPAEDFLAGAAEDFSVGAAEDFSAPEPWPQEVQTMAPRLVSASFQAAQVLSPYQAAPMTMPAQPQPMMMPTMPAAQQVLRPAPPVLMPAQPAMYRPAAPPGMLSASPVMYKSITGGPSFVASPPHAPAQAVIRHPSYVAGPPTRLYKPLPAQQQSFMAAAPSAYAAPMYQMRAPAAAPRAAFGQAAVPMAPQPTPSAAPMPVISALSRSVQRVPMSAPAPYGAATYAGMPVRLTQQRSASMGLAPGSPRVA